MFFEEHITGMTLPSGHYLQHPPQYFPPSPAFPLTREMASQQAVTTAVPPPPPVPTMPHACDGPQCPCCSSPVDRARSVSEPTAPQVTVDGEGHMHISTGGGKEKVFRMVAAVPAVRLAATEGQVCLHAGAIHVRADSIHASPKGTIVLEGHVHLHYVKGDVTSEVHASRIEIKTTGEASFTITP
jgi:hypothetical protein